MKEYDQYGLGRLTTCNPCHISSSCLMSCPPAFPAVFQQIKEVLLELSMAFDNFIQVNDNNFENDSKAEAVNRSPVFKFQRKKTTTSDNTSFSNNSSSSNSSSSAGSRKRSWESDELQNSEQSNFDYSTFSGKRSKSLVLTQELEGLRLSSSSTSSPSKLDFEINDWLDQDLNSKSIILIERFEDLKREIESIGNNGSIDDILKVLCSYKNNTDYLLVRNHLVTMTHWIKWGIINEVNESIKSPDLQVKTILNRSLLLLKALNRISSLLDWSDPELSFILNKFLITLLSSQKFKNVTTTVPTTTHRLTLVLNKKLEEYLGLLRVLNLFSRLQIPQSSINFLLSRPDTSNQIIELLQLLFENNLNVFELTATISSVNKDFSNFNAAAISVLLTLKIVENYSNSFIEIKDLILNIKNKIK